MDKETLKAIREMIREELNPIKNDIQGIKTIQGEHTKKLDGITDEVARLREDVTVLKSDAEEMKIDLKLVKIATVEHSNEIEKLKVAK